MPTSPAYSSPWFGKVSCWRVSAVRNSPGCFPKAHLGAHAAAERARGAISAARPGDLDAVTASAGCAHWIGPGRRTSSTDWPTLRCSGRKSHGRDCAVTFEQGAVNDIPHHERTAQMERARALGALRALARAVDARDPATQRHSERVATLPTIWQSSTDGASSGPSACARPRSSTMSARSVCPTRFS